MSFWLAGAALGGVLAMIEWRRADRTHRVPRLLLACVAAFLLGELARRAVPPAPPSQHPGMAAPPALRFDVADEVRLGHRLGVQGTAVVAPGDSGWVVLHDPAGPRDSAIVRDTAPDFRLADRPRAVGALQYRLVYRSGSAPAASDSFGLAVLEPRRLSVLVLDASPSFETAYLKRWLAADGARLVIRTRLTRDLVRAERLNDSAGGDPIVFGSFDAILADAGSLAALSAGERQALLRAVEAGTGLLLTAGLPAEAEYPVLQAFRVSPAAGELDRRVTHPRWTGMPRRSRAGIEAAPLALDRGGSLAPLVLDESGRWLAAHRSVGSGAVAVTLVRAPSRWRLEGEPDLFAGYWSRLLGAIARDTATIFRVEGARPPIPDRRTELTLISSGPRPDVAVIAPDGTVEPLALARDPFEPRRWRGTFWPRVPGWHALRFAGSGERRPFLVHDVPRRPAASAPDGMPGTTPATVLLFCGFLAACTWLWAESRAAARRPRM